MLSNHPRITLRSDQRGGRPCIRGLRITVQDVLTWLSEGITPDDILADYPELEAEDIRAALTYATGRETGSVRFNSAPIGTST